LGALALLFAIHLMDVRGWLDWSGTMVIPSADHQAASGR
jgi:hypothetical protein